MIEIKKYIDLEDLPRESVKILSEVAMRIVKNSRKVTKICDDLAENEESISEDDAYQLLHFFRTELYRADLSVNEIQKLFKNKEEDKDNESENS